MTIDLAQRTTSTDLIRRSYDIEDVELRDDGDGGLTFEGVASVVDHPYPVRDRWGEYTETIRAGAFDKTLKERGKAVSLYVNHRHTDVPLATRAAGTLEISADPDLRVRASLDPARPDVQIIASAIRRGEMRQMSIGFHAMPARDQWNDTRDAVVRTEVGLRETSIVEAGANTGGTDAKIRAFADFMESLTDVEMSEDEIRRAIEHLSARLAPVDTTDEDALRALAEEFAERDREDRERLERKRLLRA